MGGEMSINNHAMGELSIPLVPTPEEIQLLPKRIKVDHAVMIEEGKMYEVITTGGTKTCIPEEWAKEVAT